MNKITLFILLLGSVRILAEEPVVVVKERRTCNAWLEQTERLRQRRDALESLVRTVPRAFRGREVISKEAFGLMERKLLPTSRYDSKFVLVGLVGPGNMAKTTLSNAIGPTLENRRDVRPEDILSPPGDLPGTTVRPVVLIAPEILGTDMMKDLEDRQPGIKALAQASELLHAKGPLYRTSAAFGRLIHVGWMDMPDVTTGDSRVELKPKHLAAVRDAILPADVVGVMVDVNNARDFHLGHLLRENFSLFGERKTFFIIRSRFCSPRALGNAARLAEELASVVHARADLGRFVTGYYAMCDDEEVYEGRLHPHLTPLNGSPEFVDLLTKIADDWEEIKGVSLDEATAVFSDGAVQGLRDTYRAHYAGQVFGAAARELSLTAAEGGAIDFPYDGAKKLWRRIWVENEWFLQKILERILSVPAGVTRFVTGLGPKDSKKLEQVAGELRGEFEASYKPQVDGALKQIADGVLRLPKNSALRVRKLLIEFAERFPELGVDTGLSREEATGLYVLRLPSRDLLNSAAREAVEHLAEESWDGLKKRILIGASDDQIISLDDQFLSDGLAKVLKEEYALGHKVRDTGLDLVALGTGWQAGQSLSQVMNGWLSPFAAVGSAGMTHIVMEGARDRAVEPLLNKWFRRWQVEMMGRNVDHAVFGALNAALTDDETLDALETVKRNLADLEVPSVDYPRHLGFKK